MSKAKLGHGVCMVRALDGRQEGTQRRRRDALVGAAHFLSHLGLSRHLGRARGVATPGITSRACARGALFTVKPGVCPTPYRARATGYITPLPRGDGFAGLIPSTFAGFLGRGPP